MVNKPLISFLILTYNQESYVENALDGAFSQTYSPLEIVVSDDASEDETYARVLAKVAAYNGPHSIVVKRNAKNLGIGRHYSEVMNHVSGEIVLLAGGDDISLPDRANDSYEILKQHPEATCVSFQLCRFQGNEVPFDITDLGKRSVEVFDLENYVSDINFHLNAPGRAFRKFAHDSFGPLAESCPVEDRPNLLRCLLHGKAISCQKIGVLYRLHDANYYASENKYSINYDEIFSNCLMDVESAMARGYLDEEKGSRVVQAIIARNDKEARKQRFFNSRVKLIAFFRYILFSKYFSSNAKRKLLAGAMGF